MTQKVCGMVYKTQARFMGCILILLLCAPFFSDCKSKWMLQSSNKKPSVAPVLWCMPFAKNANDQLAKIFRRLLITLKVHQKGTIERADETLDVRSIVNIA
jgi:hypothetical protein